MTGSPRDAFSKDMPEVQLRSLLAQAHQNEQKLLGICFGAQALAIALGGQAGSPCCMNHGGPQAWMGLSIRKRHMQAAAGLRACVREREGERERLSAHGTLCVREIMKEYMCMHMSASACK